MKTWTMLPLLLALLAPTWAAADEDPGEMANRAMTLYQDPTTRAEALALYHKALGKATGRVRIEVLKNLGKAYAAMDAYAEAYPYLHFAFISEGGTDLKIRDGLEFVRKKLSEDHVQIHVETDPTSSVVTFPGRIGPHRFRTPAIWWFKPGTYSVEVTHDGYQPKEKTLVVKAGKATTVKVVLETKKVAAPVKDPDDKAPVEGPAGPTEAGPQTARKLPPWKWALLGGGLALAAGGGATWMVGWDRGNGLSDEFSGHVAPGQAAARKAKYDQRWEREVVPFQISSYALWGVGGAAAITGLILLLTDGPPPERPAPEAGPAAAGLQVLPAFWGDGGGLVVGLSF
ncbi:MAG: carboxypeptidase-like regulatory domain-containing protein [Pseudomonadota bacterium]